MYDVKGSEIWSIDITPGESTLIYHMADVRTRAEASSIKGTIHSPILDSDRGRIIISDISGLIVCIRAQDGKTIWKRDLGDHDISIILLGHPEYVQKSGTLLVPLTNRSLVELDVENGYLKRIWNLSDRIMSSPISMVHTQLHDEITIYVVSWNGHVHAINEKSGESRWDVDLGELVESSPIVVSAEDISDRSMFIRSKDSKDDELETYQVLAVIYVKSTGGALYGIAHVVKINDKTEHKMIELFKSKDLSSEMPSFDTDFQARKDPFSSSNLFRSNLFVDKQNRAILVLGANGDLKSVDTLQDSTRWSRRLINDNDSFFTASPSRFGNLVMFSNWGGSLYGISSNDGSLLWVKHTCGGTTSSIVSTQIRSSSSSNAALVRSFAVTYSGEILAFDLIRPSDSKGQRREEEEQKKTNIVPSSIQDWIHSKLFQFQECPVNDPSARYIVFENPTHDWGIASFIHILGRLVLDVLEKDGNIFLILDNINSVYVSRMNCKERPSILCMLRPLSPCSLTHVREAERIGARIEYVFNSLFGFCPF